MKQRPEIARAEKTLESSELNFNLAKYQLLSDLEFQDTGLRGLSEAIDRTAGRDFYDVGVGLILSYPLGNRSAISRANLRKLEMRMAQTSLESVRQQQTRSFQCKLA